MGETLVDEIGTEVAEQHQISGSADIGYLFWNEEPIASQASSALDNLRNQYGQRMQQAFRDETVTTDSEYQDFVKQEQSAFLKDWESAVKGFDWGDGSG